LKEISKLIDSFLPQASFDHVAVGVLDFKSMSFEVIEAGKHRNVFFDLASVTKPMTNSISYLQKSEIFNHEMLLCLNHRGGLPSWGLLSRDSWKEQILAYKITEAETLYSDFSSLRVMLELKKIGFHQKDECQKIWDKETVYWLDLPESACTVQTGFKNGEPNFGNVHDPNAWVIKDFCTHAGLFSTISGLSRTLLNLQRETDFINRIHKDLLTHAHRFSFGWDRVMNPLDTLAGVGCGKQTFGHLGFTGTSIWIDPDKKRGHIILSNAVKNHWYDKKVLNELRKTVGSFVWAM